MTGLAKNNYIEFESDKLDLDNISSLSLLLFPHKLTIIGKDQNGAILGVHIHRFQDQEILKEILKKDSFLAKNQVSGFLYLYSDQFTLVPGMLFDPNYKGTYLNFSSPLEEQVVFYEGIQNNSIVLVSAISKDLMETFAETIPDLSLKHGVSLILDYLLPQKNDMLNQELLVIVEEGHIYLAGFAGHEMKLFNRFDVSGDQDFLKYTFSVLHQLAFDRMYCKISLIGDLDEVGTDKELLHKYFKNLEIVTPKSNQNYHPGAEGFKETLSLAAFWSN
ncbi:DUF3822 family protein [Echinicola jeungdonensis]|uniref:DUF3822 family protein n=1 Tax=Echinicola jeungdonensis TaxID=709343 RepID=A0ABV5JAT5_9BACT|nr:DUF3822 family protein [Echinicola jeungdonensis]MDN3669896.1 DUF3822 family protein [Echinicola jeungdonensis]